MRFFHTLTLFLLLPFSIYAQCTLTIEPDASYAGCMQSHSEALFIDLVNTSFTGNTVRKSNTNSSWNGGARSTAGLSGNGYVETVITQRNKTRIFGLSHSNNPNSNNINNVEYAVVLRNWGGGEIRESGSYKASLGSYYFGDVIKISVENGVVKYYKNNSLIYSSNQTPVLPLYIDLAFQHKNAELSNMKFVQTTDATIHASGSANTGNIASYNWYRNGNLLGENSSELTLSNFSEGDIIACSAIPGSGICSGQTLTSNKLVLHADNSAVGSNFYITTTPAGQGCLLAREAMRWNANIPGNIQIIDNSVRKMNGYNTSNGGIYSSNKVGNNGYLEFETGQTNKRKMLGLSSQDNGNNETGIQFAFYFESGGSLRVYENGQWKGQFGSAAPDDKLRIAVEDGVVKYYKNEELLYVSDQVPVLPLIADGTIQDIGGTFVHAVAVNPTQGDFTAVGMDGQTPLIDWKLNGQSIGESDIAVSLDALSENDVLTCKYIPSGVGCGNVAVESNEIEIIPNMHLASQLFYIDGISESQNAGMAEEEIVWDPESMQNVSVTDNDLTKVQGYNQFNAGASSLNTVRDGGYFKYVVTETNKKKAVGLSHTDQNYNYTSTDYAFLLGTNGKLTIYESGSWRLGNQNFNVGDVLRINVENNTVKYYQNGNLLYTSSVVPTLPLHADVALSNEGGTIEDARVGNPNAQKFSSHITGLGSSPQIEWYINGSPTGIHSEILDFANINDGDIITCSIRPDFSGCSAATEFASNKIKYSGPPTFTSWTGAVSSVWNNTANWSKGVPTSEISAGIPAGTPHYPVLNFSQDVKDIFVASNAMLSVTYGASLYVYGNFIVDGTFDAGSGRVAFNGAENTTIRGNNLTFNILIMSKSEVGKTVTLESPISISKKTIFIIGKILAGNHEVTYLDGGRTWEGNEDSYIVGRVRKIGDNRFRFPIGSADVFAPIQIEAPEFPTDAFAAEYKYDDPNNAGYDTDEQDGTLKTISQCEYWVLNRVAGQSEVRILLSYDAERSCGISDPSYLQVAHWNGSKWENKAMRTYIGDAQSGMIQSLDPISDFSPFTLGSLSGINPLPIELTDFSVKKDGNKTRLTWTTQSEKNNDYFTVERSQDAQTFHPIGTVAGGGTSHQKLSYQFVDQTPAAGVNYYRLSQTDYDGKQTYFDIQSVHFESKSGVVIFPNPNSGSFQIQRESNAYAKLRLVDIYGKILWQQETNQNVIEIRLPDLPKGIYFMEIDDQNTSITQKIIFR